VAARKLTLENQELRSQVGLLEERLTALESAAPRAPAARARRGEPRSEKSEPGKTNRR
jgi:hypothetical protein